MSLQGVLEQYDANHTAAGEPAPGASYALRELPIESNLYVRNMKSVMNTFNTPDVLASEGRCEFEKAIFINGYHVFFLKKSVVFFSEDGEQQFVLPLDGRPFDVYIEEIAEKVVYVLVAMHSGVYVSLLRLHTSGAVWLDWKYVELPVPTQTIHRVGEHLFTLCYNDCSLQNVSVEMGVKRVADNVVVPIGDAFSTEGDQREYQFSVDLFFKDRTQTGYGRLYRTSFFHSGILLPSYILILSDIDIRLAELDESGSPRVVGVTNEIGKICALSPPPVCRSDGENGLVLVGMTYSTDGTQQTLWGGGWNRSSWMNFLFSTKK
ncbi:hypothetical protein AGDE_15601 [Angomonas deanei]|uniref:Uncharacterized protein n=1 Tax=Angomonas deanei TaxID=59799 RepID=A0A7G2BZL3_9TRYP|nr:hypothetical protein AGDE_15601 [Angomonas deanei]CAD2212900.1 hypothetical protein, conserved [Angomonas deanei]|eukprot:EPY18781.1 hypothetical protein AGDE_15601 [Angomonas deanei]